MAVLILGTAYATLRQLNIGVYPPVDFLVYRYASAASFSGADIYADNIFGDFLPPEGLPFVYTPFAAGVLAVTNLFSAQTAFTLWTIGSAAVLAFIITLCLPRNLPRRRRLWVALLLIACCTTIIAQHFLWGQINLFLAGLCLADFFRSSNGRWSRLFPKGMLIGIAAGIKLTPAIFIPYLLITRQWRTAFCACAGFLGTMLVGAIFFPAMSLTYWFSSVWHLSSKVDLGTQFASAGNNSIQGAAAALGDWAISPSKALVIFVALLCLISAAAVFRSGQTMAAVLTVGLTANLVSPVSWLHHWVYLIPALIVLFFLGRKKVRIFVLIAMIVLAIQGPDLGEHILHSGPPWLIPLGILLRESLLLLSTTTIALFFALRHSYPRLVVGNPMRLLKPAYQ